jgi:hypothetical protein
MLISSLGDGLDSGLNFDSESSSFLTGDEPLGLDILFADKSRGEELDRDKYLGNEGWFKLNEWLQLLEPGLCGGQSLLRLSIYYAWSEKGRRRCRGTLVILLTVARRMDRVQDDLFVICYELELDLNAAHSIPVVQ